MEVLLESEEQMARSKDKGKRQRPNGPRVPLPAAVAEQTGRLLTERESQWLERLVHDPASFAVVERAVHDQARRQADLANRQRIAQLGASLVRHRSSPRHVGLNRHFLRGLVAVLSPLRPPGTSPWSVQPRPWSSFVAGVSPGDLLVFPWGLQHRLADALSRGSAQAWEPKCREQPSPPPRNDAMRCRSEVTKPA